jgi:hypothetical protein
MESRGRAATRHLAARLDVYEPGVPPPTLSVALLEVRGRAGLWEAPLHDVVLAVDVSPSTAAPAGADVDGDGETGRRANRRSTDPGDSVLAAELVAARCLLEQLDPETTRVGLVTFSDRHSVHAPLGTPASVLDALARETPEIVADGRTSLAVALAGAFEALRAEREPRKRRQRTLVLLSDGLPTAPSPPVARRQALEAADRLAELGIRVHAFALGREASEKTDAYREIAQRTGGSFVPVARPAEVVSFLREVSLTGLERVSLRNLTTGRSGRALRRFPDGSFDGFVALVAGENVIEVKAHVDGREPLVARRVVVHAPASEDDAAAAAEHAQIVELLRARTVETELAAQARAGRLSLEASGESGSDTEQGRSTRSLEVHVAEPEASQ